MNNGMNTLLERLLQEFCPKEEIFICCIQFFTQLRFTTDLHFLELIVSHRHLLFCSINYLFSFATSLHFLNLIEFSLKRHLQIFL